MTLNIMKKVSSILFIVIVFLTGCIKYEFKYQKTTTLNRYFNLDDTVSIYVKHTLMNQAENISITFDSVKNDSRCPTGAECITAGNAAIVFHYTKGNNSVYFTLNTQKNLGSDTTIDNYNIRLINLLPYPVLHTDMKYDAYHAKIMVKKD